MAWIRLHKSSEAVEANPVETPVVGSQVVRSYGGALGRRNRAGLSVRMSKRLRWIDGAIGSLPPYPNST